MIKISAVLTIKRNTKSGLFPTPGETHILTLLQQSRHKPLVKLEAQSLLCLARGLDQINEKNPNLETSSQFIHLPRDQNMVT